MSDERVTIRCATCRVPAVVENWYEDPGNGPHVDSLCADCERECRCDDYLPWKMDVYLPLINPGTATDDEIAIVRAAIEAICRLIRALFHDDAASRDDRDSLTMACVEARVMRERLCVCTFDDDVPRADCDECGGRGVLAAVECAA